MIRHLGRPADRAEEDRVVRTDALLFDVAVCLNDWCTDLDSGRLDEARADAGCGVLYGTLRDSAYKLRHMAEQEIAAHKVAGVWDSKEQNGG